MIPCNRAKGLLVFCLLATWLYAGQTAPTFDPIGLLLRVRRRVQATTSEIPNYVCTETVEQSKFIATLGDTSIPRFKKDHEHPSDPAGSCDYLAQLRKSPTWDTQQINRSSFDIAISKNSDAYLIVGKDQSTARSFRDLGPNPSTFLTTIFSTDAATFKYRGEKTVDGRTLAEFGYSVPADKSGYLIDTRIEVRGEGDDQRSETSSIVPYEGTFQVDPQTFDLVRLTVHSTHLPKQLRLCETSATFEFATVRMNGADVLIATNSVVQDNNDDGTTDRTRAAFAACHPPVGNSTFSSTSVRSAQPEGSRLTTEQKQQLTAIRQKVISTADRLPNYLCRETIDRSTFLPRVSVAANISCGELASARNQKSWRVYESQSDRLRLDVAVSRNQGEMYSWAGENRFHDRTLAELVGGGATSTGAFGDLLTAIFAAQTAVFTFAGQQAFDGRTLLKFNFWVARDRSTLIVRNYQYKKAIAFNGWFLADSRTLDLVRLVVRSDQLPEEFHACDDAMTVDYSVERLNNEQFLFPQKALFVVHNDNGSEYDDRTAFSACHEFVGQSKLLFNSEPSDPVKGNGNSPPEVFTIPAGLRFRIALANRIDTETLAAGDTIMARLSTPLLSKGKQILAPKGALVTARIIKLLRVYHPPSLTLAIRLDTIQTGGATHPFHAELSPLVKGLYDPIKPAGLTPDYNLGSFNQMRQVDEPEAGVLRFDGVTDHFTISRGLELEGITRAK